MMFFFFNDTATTEIYTLSLHDALPIFRYGAARSSHWPGSWEPAARKSPGPSSVSTEPTAARSRFMGDRKSTRLNSSHANISYAVFCLKKKKSYITTNLSRLQQSISTDQ